MEKCQHETLHFGSGGFYVICTICNQLWVAVQPHNDHDIDYDAGSHGLAGEERKKV